jgi:putative ABC transport system permease protein
MRAAVRLLWTRPAFCVSVVVTLAIGQGATTAIFSLLHALILRPLPFEEADRLIVLDALVGRDAGHLALREYR